MARCHQYPIKSDNLCLSFPPGSLQMIVQCITCPPPSAQLKLNRSAPQHHNIHVSCCSRTMPPPPTVVGRHDVLGGQDNELKVAVIIFSSYTETRVELMFASQFSASLLDRRTSGGTNLGTALVHTAQYLAGIGDSRKVTSH